MNRSLGIAWTIFLLAAVACGPLNINTPANSSPPVQPSAPAPLAASETARLPTMPQALPTATMQPTAVADTATPEATLPESTNTPWATNAPQPAAPTHLPAGEHIQLDEIHMVSLTEGWGILGRYLLTTSDGGSTWREVSPRISSPANKIYGAFPDASHAWILFSNAGQIDTSHPLAIYFTSDGGRSWSVNSGEPLFPNVMGDTTWAEFAALDPLNAWALIRGVYVGAGTHHDHELFQTTDGGQTWISLDGQISDDYTGIVFADVENGIRTLQTVGAYAAGPAAYDATTDGGANWTNVELPAPLDNLGLFAAYPYCETYSPVMQSAHLIRMLVGCFDYNDPPKKFASYLYISQDGGTSWKTERLPEQIYAPDYRLLYFGSDNALLLGTQIYASADVGKTWSLVQSVTWKGQFSFVDATHGWAVASSSEGIALVKTINGGKTWSLVKPTIAMP